MGGEEPARGCPCLVSWILNVIFFSFLNFNKVFVMLEIHNMPFSPRKLKRTFHLLFDVSL